MMQRPLALAGLLLVASMAFALSPARAERLIASVSNHRVTVTPNYSGEELVLFGSVERDANTPPSRTSYDLAYAMTMNPKMKILVQQGYFDLACPYGTVNHAIEHLNVTPELRRNVQIEYYEAGHMMYVHPQSMRKFSSTATAFIDANAN